MPKLLSLTFREPPPLPGVRASHLNTIKVGERASALAGFRVLVRGASVMFVSPANWKRDAFSDVPVGGRVVFEVPRSTVALSWAFEPGEDPDQPIKDWTQPEPAPGELSAAEMRAQAAARANEQARAGAEAAGGGSEDEDEDDDDEPVVAAAPARRGGRRKDAA